MSPVVDSFVITKMEWVVFQQIDSKGRGWCRAKWGQILPLHLGLVLARAGKHNYFNRRERIKNGVCGRLPFWHSRDKDGLYSIDVDCLIKMMSNFQVFFGNP